MYKRQAIVPGLLFPSFGVVVGAEYDNRPEALLAAMGTATAEVIVCDTVAGGITDFHLPQEKRPVSYTHLDVYKRQQSMCTAHC